MGNTSSETKHIIVLRNGDKYELTQFKSEPINSKSTSRYGKVEIFVPQKAVKISKDGTRTEMPNEEIRPWLESFHPYYNSSLWTKQFK